MNLLYLVLFIVLVLIVVAVVFKDKLMGVLNLNTNLKAPEVSTAVATTTPFTTTVTPFIATTTLAPAKIYETLTFDLQNNMITLKNVSTQTCLMSYDGTSLEFQACDTSDENFQWSYNDLHLIHNKTGKCLESSSDGLNVKLNVLSKSDLQRWYYTNNNNVIKNKSTGKCIYIDAGILKIGECDYTKNEFKWNTNINSTILRRGVGFDNSDSTFSVKIESDGRIVTRQISNPSIIILSFSDFKGTKYLIPKDGEIGVAPKYNTVEQFVGSINTSLVFNASTGRLTLINQNDVVVWKSVSTFNPESAPYSVVFQKDRNFVVYDKNKSAVWASAG